MNTTLDEMKFALQPLIAVAIFASASAAHSQSQVLIEACNALPKPRRAECLKAAGETATSAGPSNSRTAATSPNAPTVKPSEPRPTEWRADSPLTVYANNDGQSVVSWFVEKLARLPGKPDQFSTKEERNAYLKRIDDLAAEFGPIPIAFKCQAKYDADKQSFFVRTPAFSAPDARSQNFNPEPLEIMKISVGSQLVSRDSYAGQNAYGATIQVSRTKTNSFAVLYSMSEGPDFFLPSTSPSSGYRARYGSYVVNFPMPSDLARQESDHIRCLAVATPVPPYIVTYDSNTAPTRDLPFETQDHVTGLVARLDRLIFFNTASGESYATYLRPGIR
jgi:hypothetical protein